MRTNHNIFMAWLFSTAKLQLHIIVCILSSMNTSSLLFHHLTAVVLIFSYTEISKVYQLSKFNIVIHGIRSHWPVYRIFTRLWVPQVMWNNQPYSTDSCQVVRHSKVCASNMKTNLQTSSMINKPKPDQWCICNYTTTHHKFFWQSCSEFVAHYGSNHLVAAWYICKALQVGALVLKTTS